MYWIEKAKNREVPVYFIRFEDLIHHPQSTLEEAFKFLFVSEDLEGKVI